MPTYTRNAANTGWVLWNEVWNGVGNGSSVGVPRVRRGDNGAFLSVSDSSIKRMHVRNAGNTAWLPMWTRTFTTPSAPGFSGFQLSPFGYTVRLNVSSLEAGTSVSINYTIDLNLGGGTWSAIQNATLVPSDTDDTVDYNPGADGSYEFRCRYRYTDGFDSGPWSAYTTITVNVFV